MSRDIRSFFQLKKPAKPQSCKKAVEDDDDVIPESPDVQIKNKKKDSRKKRIISDDSDDESSKPKNKSLKDPTSKKTPADSNPKSKPGLKEIKPVDLFGGPIKRTEPLVQKKKKTETGIHSDEEFEKSLLEIDSIDNTDLPQTSNHKDKSPIKVAESKHLSNTNTTKSTKDENNSYASKEVTNQDKNETKTLGNIESNNVKSKEAFKIDEIGSSVTTKKEAKDKKTSKIEAINVLEEVKINNKRKFNEFIETDGKVNETKKTKLENEKTSNDMECDMSIMSDDDEKGMKKKHNRSLNESVLTDEERHERKRYSAALYQKYLNRSGPKHLGAKQIPEGAPGCLKDCAFLLTGVLDSFERDEIADAISKYGGCIKNSISKKVTHVLAGDDAGPAKMAKAQELGIKIINEDEFLELIINNSKKPDNVKSEKVKKEKIRDKTSSKEEKPCHSNESKTPIKTSSKREKRGHSNESKTPIKSSKEEIVSHSNESKTTIKTSSKEKKRDHSNENKTQIKTCSKEEIVSHSNESKTQIKNVKNEPQIEESSNKTLSVSKNRERSKSPKKIKEEVEEKQSTSTKFDRDMNTNNTNHVNDVEQSSSKNKENCKPINSSMWVEKYKPQNVKQIIGQHGDASNVKKLTNWLTNWYAKRKAKLPKPNPWAKNDDGGYYKAALLSGPPGVGKTTTVSLVCKELGFDVVEFNASDTRNKTLIKEQIGELLTTNSLSGYARGDTGKQAVTKKHVLVMDEVDGMAGNEDRGGLQELINLIKVTSVPIICMCNDRNSQKMRSLVNYCYDLRFNRPRVDQIKSAMRSVCFKEGINIPPDILSQLIVSANQDVRQTLNLLSMWAVEPNLADTERLRKDASITKKDIKLGPWEAVRKVFSAEDHKKMSIIDRSDLFFYDYSLAPLFVQENYLQVQPHCPKHEVLKRISKAADSISLGDLVDARIRGSQAWSLLPLQAMYSSVIPGHILSGHVAGQIQFPGWLGKNSRASKLHRLCQEIHAHTRLSTSGSKSSIFLDYSTHLRDAIVNPLIKDRLDGIEKSLEVLESYHLLREDLESLVELSLWPGQRNPTILVDSKIKAAMTRTYNKKATALPYAPAAVKRGRAKEDDEMEAEDGEQEFNDEGDEDSDPENDALIKKKKSKESDQASSSKDIASTSKEKPGKAKGKKK